MKIGLQTWGSHGDVAPFFALAGGLRAAGHEVELVATTSRDHDYTALARRLGIDFEQVGPAFEMPSPEELRRIVRTRDGLREVELLNRYFFDPAIEAVYAASRRLCADHDLVVGHFWLHPLVTAAELAGVRHVVVHLSPIGVRSRHVPAIGPDLGPWINGLIRDLGDTLMRRRAFRSADALRAREGLAPIVSPQQDILLSRELTLVAVSPALCPRPPDWGGAIEVTGFLNPPAPSTVGAVPDELEAFLEAGESPVYFTFGSCEVFFGEENVALFLETIERAGGRAVIQTRFADAFRDAAGPGVFFADAVDHARVFERCCVVVHHGGAGTTQSTLLARRPAVVVEHGFDQTYWGRRLVAAGASPRLLHRRSVTPRRLAAAIGEARRSPRFERNAAVLGRALASENGIATAVKAIESRFA